jgi:Spy/CpxP family protein refolding chaperone
MQSYFSRNRIMLLVSVALIATNLLVLGYALLKKDRHHEDDHRPPVHGQRIEDLLRDELKMTDEQFAAYGELIDVHRRQRKECKDETKAMRKELLMAIGKENNDSTVKELSKKIGEREALFEMQTYEHFKAVYDLLDASQKKEFGKFMEEVASKLDPGPPHGPPPPRK